MHPSKALFPIDFTESEILMHSNNVHFENALSSIVVTVDGIFILVFGAFLESSFSLRCRTFNFFGIEGFFSITKN